LLIEERRQGIINYLEKKDKATIEDVMNLLKISRSTVRRDFIDLENKNLIIRSRGGVLKKRYFKYELSLNEKKVLNLDKKKKIAAIARKFINEGDVIYLSGGTTTLELAKSLNNLENIIVFTNAINILLELVDNINIKIKVLGGDFRRKTFSLVGQDSINFIKKYNFDKVFMGANGISINEGITTPNEGETLVDGEVLKRSKEVFLLADDSKFGAVAYSKICDLENINYIITNKELNKDLLKDFEAKGIKVLTK